MRKNIFKNLIIIFLLIFLFFQSESCKKNNEEVIIPPDLTDTIPKIPGWSLVWNDEFSDKNIDQTKWSHEVNGDGGGNNELQYYTARAENSHIENGNLIIEARKESYLGKNYTSARMRTLKKVIGLTADLMFAQNYLLVKVFGLHFGCCQLIGNMAAGL